MEKETNLCSALRIFKDYEIADNALDSSDEDDDEYFNGQDENLGWDAEDEDKEDEK